MRVLALFAVLFLVGCSSLPSWVPFTDADKKKPLCARVAFIADSDRIALDANTRAAMTGVSYDCNFSNPQETVVEMTLPFLGGRKISGEGADEVHLPYFIALLAPDETVLSRADFTTEIDFDGGDTMVEEEEHIIRIPAGAAEAYKYRIAIGFALTPEQLAENRKKKEPPAAKSEPKAKQKAGEKKEKPEKSKPKPKKQKPKAAVKPETAAPETEPAIGLKPEAEMTPAPDAPAATSPAVEAPAPATAPPAPPEPIAPGTDEVIEITPEGLIRVRPR